MKVHLDTDFGGDPDDACALAMLLGWPGVEITGITTTLDRGGRRAGYVTHCLELAGRTDILVAAGSNVSLTTLQTADPAIGAPYWSDGIVAHPSPPGAALDLLHRSIEMGATIIGIGPYTSLALLEIARSGSLARVPVVVMGGWIQPAASGLPDWGPDMDFNVQWDTYAARIVASSARLTLVTIAATLKAPLRMADLPRLLASGPIGQLLARQSQAYALETSKMELGRSYPGLPDDLLNLHWDPVTCAVALGWSGATVEEQRLEAILDDELLRFKPSAQGRPTRVVVDVDGDDFSARWLSAVEAAQK